MSGGRTEYDDLKDQIGDLLAKLREWAVKYNDDAAMTVIDDATSAIYELELVWRNE